MIQQIASVIAGLFLYDLAAYLWYRLSLKYHDKKSEPVKKSPVRKGKR